jgi:hypothetical protein
VNTEEIHMTTLSRGIAACLAAVAMAAHAAPPANIANTTWTLRVDGGADEVLFIDTQAGPGAPGNTYCRAVRGHLAGFVPVHGWYCPGDGRIHLLHTNVNSGVVMRAFMGNVADEVAGQPLRIRGTAAIDYSTFGDLGEVPFRAIRQ